jgi:hypothetical protein
MANEENLNPIRTEKEARELGKLGGIASGEARRAKKTMKAMLDYLLDKEIENSKTGEMVTCREAMLSAMVKKAIKGDVKACQFVRDTSGEAPITKTELTGKNGTPLVRTVFVTQEEDKEIEHQIDELLNE